MDRLLALLRTRRGSAILAALVLAAVATFVPRSDSVANAAPFPLDDLPTGGSIDDGFNHFVVEVPNVPGAAAGALAPSTTSEPVLEAPGGPLPDLDADALAEVGDRNRGFVREDDAVYAVLDDGTRVRVDAARPAEEPAPAAPAPAGDEPEGTPIVIARLLADPAVDRATHASGPYWSVVTALDTDAFAVVAKNAGVASVTRDEVLTTYSDDTHSQWLWGLENPGGRSYGGVAGVADADADGVEARSAVEGTGVVVAVIDSGVQADHEDLRPLWRNTGETGCTNGVDDDGNGYVDDCNGWDFANGDNTPYVAGSDVDHGTHVATTIAAIRGNGKGTAGLASGVTIMNLKALENGSMYMSSGAAAIRYAVDNGARVINASWGSGTGIARNQVPSLDSAIEYARSHGVVFVAAAGNNSGNLDASPQWPASFPQDNVITVGASMADDRPASFSNFGRTTVELYAPGHYIVAGVGGNGYRAMQGTSMAAPHVAAAAALVVAQQPDATIAEIRAALLSGADPVPSLSSLSSTGGRLNAARSLGLQPDEDPIKVSVAGADGLTEGELTELALTTELADPGLVPDGRAVQVRATVLTAQGGTTYAVTGLPLTVDGSGAMTDAQASVAVSDRLAGDLDELRAGTTARLGLALPAGSYALAVELVDADDPAVAYGPAATVFLTVDRSLTAPTTTTPAPVPGPGATTTTTVAPGPSPTTTTTAPRPASPGPSTTTTAPRPTPTPTSTSTTAPAPAPGPTSTTAPRATPTTAAPAQTTTTAASAPTTTSTPPTTAPVRTTTTSRPPSQASTTTTTPRSSSTVPAPSTPGPTTTAPAPPPTPPTTTPPGPVANDGLRIDAVSPASGPVGGGSIVAVRGGGFTEHVRVLFGERAGRLIARSATMLLVEAPAAAAAGRVDVTVADFVGNDVTMSRGFSYVAPTTQTPAPTPNPTPTPTTIAPVPSPTTTTTAPSSSGPSPTTTTVAPAPGPGATTTTTSAAPTTTAPMPSGGRSRLVPVGPPSQVDGLSLVRVSSSPVSASPSSWSTLACRAATCTATVNR